jgi:hypothetical protein
MKNNKLLDIYSEYLISSFGQTTGTGLAGLLGGSVSHDQIQRLLSKEQFNVADLWGIVKRPMYASAYTMPLSPLNPLLASGCQASGALAATVRVRTGPWAESRVTFQPRRSSAEATPAPVRSVPSGRKRIFLKKSYHLNKTGVLVQNALRCILNEHP